MSATAATAEQCFHEGVRLMAAGEAAPAMAAFRQALVLAPDLAEAHGNLGLLLDEAAQWVEAENHYRRALALNPRQEQTLLNLGALLGGQKRFIEAEASYRQALAHHPAAPAPWSNLGVLLASLQREDEAEQCYRRAMALAPDQRKAAFNLAYLLLRQGRFEEGWLRLESRDWYAPLENYLRCPRWQGQALHDKSLLIGFESGHGDMIQFCRYAALAKAQGASRVSVLCHPGLKTLFARLTGVDEAIAVDQSFSPNAWDYWTPPLSLPFYFQTRLDTIPAALPYIQADPEQVRHWTEAMACPRGNDSPLRVGLVWKGNPQFENDTERSLPSLDLLAPLGEVAQVHFFSLQKGRGEDEAAQPPPGLKLTALGHLSRDFADTAAMVMNLDLVISVDTAVAHLTGALGKPCWLLLPWYQTDWRWLKERQDSPWYPGVMRLFRQQTMGDWGPTIAELKSALQAWVAQRSK